MLFMMFFPNLLADRTCVELFVPGGPLEQLFQEFFLKLKVSERSPHQRWEWTAQRGQYSLWLVFLVGLDFGVPTPKGTHRELWLSYLPILPYSRALLNHIVYTELLPKPSLTPGAISCYLSDISVPLLVPYKHFCKRINGFCLLAWHPFFSQSWAVGEYCWFPNILGGDSCHPTRLEHYEFLELW